MATIKFSIPDVPYSQVEYDTTELSEVDAINLAKAFREQFLIVMGAQQQPASPSLQRPAFAQPASQQARSASSGGRRETRADKYPPVSGMQCDVCGGPVGRYPKTGRMTSDKAVCLGRCNDGQYVHTVGWLEDEDGGGGYRDDLPF